MVAHYCKAEYLFTKCGKKGLFSFELNRSLLGGVFRHENKLPVLPGGKIGATKNAVGLRGTEKQLAKINPPRIILWSGDYIANVQQVGIINEK